MSSKESECRTAYLNKVLFESSGLICLNSVQKTLHKDAQRLQRSLIVLNVKIQAYILNEIHLETS